MRPWLLSLLLLVLPACVPESSSVPEVDLEFRYAGEASAEEALEAFGVRCDEWERELYETGWRLDPADPPRFRAGVLEGQEAFEWVPHLAVCGSWIYPEEVEPPEEPGEEEGGAEPRGGVSTLRGPSAAVHLVPGGAPLVRLAPGLEDLAQAENALVSHREGVSWRAYCTALQELNELGIESLAVGWPPEQDPPGVEFED